ncbi:HesA/MoeB/ThiF family protein [Sphingomonas sp.]|jgi:adenylyltransferase/sulfurtransferase|uniref:HesA/MoeB/ThiF family protein n=1 Tax=Sphingomonas sp. TaxID=28214 RepID=UPI002ED78174
MTLSDAELDRYARHIVLREFGGAGQMRLKGACVAVIGAGGIGSPAIQYLAAAGVGRLVIFDDDLVEASNLQRQTIFATDDSGTPKVRAAAARAIAINPHIAAEPRAIRLDAENVTEALVGIDVVLDGCDNFATRLTVADAAFTARLPLVSAAIDQFEGQLGVYRGWEAGRPCYRCFVGDSPARDGVSCADNGILGPVAGMLGSLAALEVLRAITPFGDDPAGSLLLVDLLALRFRTIRLAKEPTCRTCGEVGRA